MKDRELLSFRDGVILFVLLLAALALWLALSRSPKGLTAVVELDGEPLRTVDLTKLDGQERQTVQGRDGICCVIVFSPDGVEMAEADCFDKLCVRKGKIALAGEAIICAPARVAVRLEGGTDKTPDAETF